MAVATARKRRMSKGETRKLLTGLMFVSPWLLGFLLWTLYPLLSSAYYSFTRYDLIKPPIWIGLGNFTEIFTDDPRFWTVVYNTIFYVGISVPLGVAVAFLLASLLNTKIVARSTFRAIFYIPAIVPAVCSAMVWLFIYNNQYGVINNILRRRGSRSFPFSPAWSGPSPA